MQGRSLPAGTGKQLLDSLAGGGERRVAKDGSLSALAGTVAAHMPLSSVVVLVCGSRTSPRRAARGLRPPAVRRPRARDRRPCRQRPGAAPHRRRRRDHGRRARAAAARPREGARMTAPAQAGHPDAAARSLDLVAVALLIGVGVVGFGGPRSHGPLVPARRGRRPGARPRHRAAVPPGAAGGS